ncbi:MAG: hypothetical protein QN209_10245 [Armatimonadota bacterium]|nr:hypothetical protein [Armatimonadota bacterium]
MSKTLTLNDAEYEAVRRAAQTQGLTPEAWIAQAAHRLLDSKADQGDGMLSVADISPYPGLEHAPDYMQAWAERRAAERGGTPEEHLRAWWEKMTPRSMPALTDKEQEKVRRRMRRHFGAVSSGDPHSADNERIDRDLMRYYQVEASQEDAPEEESAP